MTIRDEGFLAPQIDGWVQKYRAENTEAFELSTDLNRVAHRLMLNIEVQTGDPERDSRTLTALLFVRMLSNFQGVVVTAERGMIVEARTLARTCLESTFALVAGVKDQEAFVPKMIAHAMEHRSKAANWLLGRANRKDFLATTSEEKLREFLAKLGDDGELLATFAIIDMARRAQLEDMYIFYRVLSGDAAHPTIDALDRYISDIRVGNFTINWGPRCGAAEITDTLLLTCSFVFASCVAINEHTNDEGCAGELDRLWQRYKILAEKYGDSNQAQLADSQAE